MTVVLGVQLGYHGIGVLGDLPGQDLERALSLVSSSGYSCVEVMTDVVGRAPARLAALARAADLSIAGLHLFVEDMSDVDHVSSVVRDLGASRVFVSASCQGWGHEDYRAFSSDLSHWGKRLRDEQVSLYFHPHDLEFQPLDTGAYGLAVIAEHTSQDHVLFVIDTYWSRAGGAAPDEMIRTYADRVDYLHLKGNGDTSDFSRAVAAVERDGDWHVMIEEDRSDGDPEVFLTSRRLDVERMLSTSR